MKQEFSEKEAADSMRAAASRLNVPLDLVNIANGKAVALSGAVGFI